MTLMLITHHHCVKHTNMIVRLSPKMMTNAKTVFLRQFKPLFGSRTIGCIVTTLRRAEVSLCFSQAENGQSLFFLIEKQHEQKECLFFWPFNMIVKPCSQRAQTTSCKLHVSQYFNTSTKSITSELPRRHALGLSANELYFPTFDDAVLFPPSHQAVIFQARLKTHHSAVYCKPTTILNHCGSLDVPSSKKPLQRWELDKWKEKRFPCKVC